jgi:hypothetical protein
MQVPKHARCERRTGVLGRHQRADQNCESGGRTCTLERLHAVLLTFRCVYVFDCLLGDAPSVRVDFLRALSCVMRSKAWPAAHQLFLRTHFFDATWKTKANGGINTCGDNGSAAASAARRARQDTSLK